MGRVFQGWGLPPGVLSPGVLSPGVLGSAEVSRWTRHCGEAVARPSMAERMRKVMVEEIDEDLAPRDPGYEWRGGGGGVAGLVYTGINRQ